MKIRSGFVSNSSSSSFVIFGYQAQEIFDKNPKKDLMDRFAPGKHDEDIKKWGLDEAFDEFIRDTNFGLPGVKYLSDDGPGYIGLVLADVASDECYIESDEFDLDELKSKAAELAKILGIDDKPKIFVGTRSC